jgi:putative peptide zinc metalloprotease protein
MLSAGFLTLLVALLIVPWEQHIAAPAVLKPALHNAFYSPVAARLDSVNVEPGQLVSESQVLFSLYSSALEFHAHKARNEIRLYQSSLARLGRSDFLEARDVVHRQLLEAQSAYRGYLDQIDQLDIKAPFAGEVVAVADNLTAGQWVSDTLPLAILADKSTLEVYAYATEDDLKRIQSDAASHFYAENLHLEPVRVSITEIDRASTTSFVEPMLASIYGGPIATRDAPTGELVPQEALYRLRMAIEQPRADLQSTVLRGTVHIEAEAESWSEKIWRQISAVLIRESDF